MMCRSTRVLAMTLFYGLLGLSAITTPARAEAVIDEKGRFKFIGDFRFRMEADWDSQDAAGVERDDRNRVRARARLGIQFDPYEYLSCRIRFRTGGQDNQQSGYVTLFESENDGPNASQVDIDHWYAAFRKWGAWVWGGRNDFPFWQQNEWVWDADVSLVGVAGGKRIGLDKHTVDFSAGYFALPDGMQQNIGNLAAGQVVWARNAAHWGFTTAGGAMIFYGEEGATVLLNGNGARDYKIATASLQGRFNTGAESKWHVTTGVDVFHNMEDYSRTDPDPYTVAHRDETEGWVASATVGRREHKGDWLFGVWYARVQALALNSSYVQDDWARWGNSNQGALTDFEGWELRGVYSLTTRLRVVGRLFFAEAITSVEDGKRFRVDLGYDL